jgi:cytidine deaminase
MDHDQLINEALTARHKAYAPYSNFLVGAALLCKDGTIFHGCNVENASYGLCNCAERTALYCAIAAGYKPRQFSSMAVAGNTDGPISPCGSCRQVMLELGGASMEVVLANLQGLNMVTTAGDLLPHAFSADDLTK